MSIKLEKTDVSSARSRSWLGVSKEAIIGVKKCCKKLAAIPEVYIVHSPSI